MTEAEWLVSDDPALMLALVVKKHRERKLRLFLAACCRRVWPLIIDPSSRKAVEAAESYADDCFDGVELGRVADDADRAIGRIALRGEPQEYAAIAAAWTADWERFLGAPEATVIAACSTVPKKMQPATRERELQHQCKMLRCIFGTLPNSECLRRPTSLPDPILPLCDAIYSDRAFDRLPILADALEDAGCTDSAMLDHCRGPAPHVRGCWVVDLLLGKE